MLEWNQQGILSLNWKKLQINVQDLLITLNFKNGRFLLLLFSNLFLNQIIICQEMVKL